MKVLERLEKALNFEDVYPVPVAFWNLAPWMPSMLGVDSKN